VAPRQAAQLFTMNALRFIYGVLLVKVIYERSASTPLNAL
jgi:hypothetical protein